MKEIKINVTLVGCLAGREPEELGKTLANQDALENDQAELAAWRESAKLCEASSPEELASIANLNAGQFVDRKIVCEWQLATECQSPQDARELLASWRSSTGCEYPEGAREQKKRADQFSAEWSEVTHWQSETGCMTATGAGERIRYQSSLIDKKSARVEDLANEIIAWQAAAACETAKEADAMFDAWQKETGCLTPESAGERIRSRDGAARDAISDEKAWQMETGCMTATGAGELIRSLHKKDKQREQSWCEATGKGTPGDAEAMIEALREKIVEYEATILAYTKEINEMKHAIRTFRKHSEPIGVVAEGAQTGQPVFVAVGAHERELAKLRAELHTKCREAQTERERADAANEQVMEARLFISNLRSALGVPHETVSLLDWCKEARARAASNDLLVKQVDAQLDAFRSVVRKARVAAGIDGDGNNMPLADWCNNARINLASAIIPLPKPEKVEPGQKWAFVMTSDSGKEQGNNYLVARFRNSGGKHFAAFQEDIDAGFYLGKP